MVRIVSLLVSFACGKDLDSEAAAVLQVGRANSLEVIKDQVERSRTQTLMFDFAIGGDLTLKETCLVHNGYYQDWSSCSIAAEQTEVPSKKIVCYNNDGVHDDYTSKLQDVISGKSTSLNGFIESFLAENDALRIGTESQTAYVGWNSRGVSSSTSTIPCGKNWEVPDTTITYGFGNNQLVLRERCTHKCKLKKSKFKMNCKYSALGEVKDPVCIGRDGEKHKQCTKELSKLTTKGSHKKFLADFFDDLESEELNVGSGATIPKPDMASFGYSLSYPFIEP